MDTDIEQKPNQSPSGDSSSLLTLPAPAVAPINTHRMRRMRPWYLFPLEINVALIYSSRNLLLTVETPLGDDVEFPVCEWLLYTSVAILSPLFLVMSRLLPDPSMGLCLGGLFSSSGLLWASTASHGSLEQKLAYSLGSGIGISLSMQAITLAISPYFVKEGVRAAGTTLLLSLFTMLATYHATDYLAIVVGNYVLMLCLGILVLVTSCLPPAVYLLCTCTERIGRRRLRTHAHERDLFGDVPILSDHKMEAGCHGTIDNETLLSDHQEDIEEADQTATGVDKNQKGCLSIMGNGLAVIMEDTSWKTSFLSVLVWLTWGAGVDTTWLDIGWSQELMPYPHRLPSLHLIIAFSLLAIKLASQQWLLPQAGIKVNLASNYMYLGLLGCSGVLLCLFPESSHPLHGSLLFTVSLALQYDDLSDLCLLPASQQVLGKRKTGAVSALVSSISPFSSLQSSRLSSSEATHKQSLASKHPLLVPATVKPQSFPSPASPELKSKPVSTYALVGCNIMTEEQANQQQANAAPRGNCYTLICLVGHSLSLFMMATLSMVLGLQIANLLRELFTLPPFSYLCSSGGLLVLSSAAIGVSLGKPDVWLGDKRGYAVLS